MNIHFGTIQYGWIFPLFLILFGVLILKFRKKELIINSLSKAKFRSKLILNHSYKRNLIKLILAFIGFLFLFIALLSPQWNKTEEDIQQKGREILIALDISKSMLAKDLTPNRLEMAKNKIKSLLNMTKSDRIGLILFSGTAFVQCPLTRDFSAFYMFLDQVDVESISNGTTSIDNAIKVAIEAFKNSQNAKNKILIIFTDGEDFSSNLANIKKEAQKENLHIFSVGTATIEGAPIPLYDEEGKQTGHQLNNAGSIVISKLNKGILQNLSNESGALYTKITKNNDDLKFILQDIKKFETEQFGKQKMSYFQEQYPYFVTVSFLAFGLEWIL